MRLRSGYSSIRPNRAAVTLQTLFLAGRRLDLLVAVWSCLIAAALFGAFRSHGFDDPYITYRYAVNLAAGYGFVYNPGERVLSTSAPLYALLLTPVAALGLDVPLISNLIGCVSLGAGALALWRLGRLADMPVAGGVAALLYPLSPYLVSTLGAETTFFMALTLWGFVAVAAGRPIVAGLLLAAATLTRADAALAAVMAALVYVCCGRDRNPFVARPDSPTLVGRVGEIGLTPFLRFSAAYLLVIVPWILAAWAYFGTPLPVTLSVKRSQAFIPGSRSYLAGLVQRLVDLVYRPLFWPLLGLAPLGAAAALRRRGPLLLPLGWGGLHALAYSSLGVTAYFWYYGPAALALIVAAALGANLLWSWLHARVSLPVSWPTIGSLIGVALAGHGLLLAQLAAHPDPRLHPYREAGRWLAANAPSDARVGVLEAGIIGYYSHRPIVDFAGLINPEITSIFRGGGDYAAAARQAIMLYRPTYLVNQEAALPVVSVDAALAERCTVAASFLDPRYPAPLRIYQCRWA